MRQGNNLSRAQTRQRMIEQAQHEVYKGFVDNPTLIQSLYKSEPLSETEWIRLSGWLLGAMRQRDTNIFRC